MLNLTELIGKPLTSIHTPRIFYINGRFETESMWLELNNEKILLDLYFATQEEQRDSIWTLRGNRYRGDVSKDGIFYFGGDKIQSVRCFSDSPSDEEETPKKVERVLLGLEEHGRLLVGFIQFAEGKEMFICLDSKSVDDHLEGFVPLEDSVLV